MKGMVLKYTSIKCVEVHFISYYKISIINYI